MKQTTTMRPFLLALLVTIISFPFISCKKENTKTDQISDIGFTANGTSYKWDFKPFDTSLTERKGAHFLKTISVNTNDTIYVLVGINLPAIVKIECVIHTSQLKTGTYKRIIPWSDKYVESNCYMNNTSYSPFTDDIMRVTITDINKNFVSGTFSATMHDVTSQSKTLTIWDGYFNHIPILE